MTRLHPLYTDVAKPRRFTYPFCYQPHPLCLLAAAQVQAYIASVAEWADEAAQGKMFGVLVVEDGGRLGFLAAFSGLLGGSNDWPYFVPAVYNLLNPDGHFKQVEGEIDSINGKVTALEHAPRRARLMKALGDVKEESAAALDGYREEMRQRKAAATGDERIRVSQHMNAELRRMKKHYATLQGEAEEALAAIDAEIDTLKRQRKHMSDELQRWLFSQYVMLNARGERRDLCDIFAATTGGMPPSGSGECCAPKLLQYAYEHGLRPVCMAEFWWGASPKAEVRHHLHYYPACRGKCKPILEHMLQGLDVDPDPRAADEDHHLTTIYDDSAIAVVCKPAGMLSVPGKSVRRSVLSEMRRRYPDAHGPMIVHRLDMDTSGLMVVAKTMDAYLSLQRQFSAHAIKKRYVALLSHRPSGPLAGTISLPLSADIMDRPRQIVDKERGKEAVTDYKVSVEGAVVRAELYPRTGRTHQLRVHCAHPCGLDAPIVGDPLYGQAADRLYLHAERIEFAHPLTGQAMAFEVKAPFSSAGKPQ